MTAILLVILLWQQAGSPPLKTTIDFGGGTTGAIGLQLEDPRDWPVHPGECFEVTDHRTLEKADCAIYPKHLMVPAIPPWAERIQIDVPPVTVTEDIPDGTLSIVACEPSICESSSVCSKPGTQRVTYETCADKSRFYLPSVDGKYHCLALGQKP